MTDEAKTVEYTYPAKIQQVKAASNGYSQKGEAQETTSLEVTVLYDGTTGVTDSFSVGADKSAEFVIGRHVQVVLRLPAA